MTAAHGSTIWLISLALGVALATGAFGSAAFIRRLQAIPSASLSLPGPLRPFWRLSGLLPTLSPAFLPARSRRAIASRLRCCDLDSLLSIERWMAMRLLQALAGAATGALFAKGLGLPVPAFAAAGLLAGACAGGWWLQRHRLRREFEMLRDLPTYLDVLTLCVEAGSTLTTGMRVAIEKSPPGPLRQVFERVLREIRSGRSRVEALEQMAVCYRMEALSALSAALIQGESTGMSLGNVLRAQAEQRVAERFARAERMALQAPVKLLGPLLLCIFPCTFIVIAVPIVARILGLVQS